MANETDTDGELDGVAQVYGKKVGDRLRAIRRQKGMSLQDAEEASAQEFKASVLGAYERGERSISVPRLQRLARFYNVPVDQLLPRDMGPDAAWAPMGDGSAEGEEPISDGRIRRLEEDEKVTIDLTNLDAVGGPERDLLRRYLSMIQVQRQDFNGRMLTIRSDDVRAIGCLFDLTLDGMRRRLDDLGLRIHS